MIEVRIHLNPERPGTTWWAEGGDFVGGADNLNHLVKRILEWAEEEPEGVTIKLDPPTPPPSTSHEGLGELRVDPPPPVPTSVGEEVSHSVLVHA